MKRILLAGLLLGGIGVGCAGKQIVFHPIIGEQLEHVSFPDSTEAQIEPLLGQVAADRIDGWWISDEYLHDVMEAVIEAE